MSPSGTAVALHNASLVWGSVVQAALTEPIVTDYVPVARPPWLLVALAVVLLAFVMPREVVVEFVAASAIACCVVMATNWLLVRLRNRRLTSDGC